MTEVILKEKDQALSCSLLSRFSEDIFIKLNKLFILACNLDVLFQEDDMINKLNEKEIAKKIVKRITKKVVKRIKNKFDFLSIIKMNIKRIKKITELLNFEYYFSDFTCQFMWNI